MGTGTGNKSLDQLIPKEGHADTYARLVGRKWSSAFPDTVFDVRSLTTWLFGPPLLRAANAGRAYWARSNALSQWQKGSGWQACLYGGVQSGDDWAAAFVDVNEMPIADFNEAYWAWYQTNAETMGLGIVIWIHDPINFDNRAEVTQVGGAAGLDKGAGWNSHEWDPTATQMFYYGENTTGSNLTAGTQYTWKQFQQDSVFKRWTIYRISLEWGWEASGTFEEVWLAQLKLQGWDIPIKPRSDADLVPVKQYATATTGALANTLAPKTPFRLLSVDLKVNTAGTTDESFTITQDAGEGAAYDRLIASQNTKTPAVTSLYLPFGEGYDFVEGDELDAAWPNTENRTYGLVWTWKPL